MLLSSLDFKENLLDLLARESYRCGNFTLSSGAKSNHYVNCKPVTLNGLGLGLTSSLLLDKVESEAMAVAGLTLGADPLVSGVALVANQKGRNLGGLIIRKEPKGHGTGAWIEGPLPPKGSLITVLEDVVTSGNSSLKAANKLREFGYEIRRVVAIIDREEGAYQTFKQNDLDLISIFSLSELISKYNQLDK